MNLFGTQEKFTVEDCSSSFRDLVEKKPQLSAQLADSDVVILPSHGTEDEFYSGSLDVLDHLNENSVKSEIYATDEEYKELSLHGADIWLGSFFISNLIIPIFCSVIAGYIYDKLKAKDDDKISLTFVVEKKDGKTASVDFKGEVKELTKALNAVKSFSDED